MSREPTTFPIERRVGNAPAISYPTIRPLSAVPSDFETDWIPLREGVEMLVPLYGSFRVAGNELLYRRVLTGVVPVSCEMLIYERTSGGREQERFAWPGASARLAEQMLKANGEPRSGFRYEARTDSAEWLDVTGPYAVNALALTVSVDREAIVAMLAKRTVAPQAAPLPPVMGEVLRKPFDRLSPDADVSKWYQERVSQAPAEGYARREDEDAARAVGIGRDRVRGLRKRFAPVEWQRAGK